MLQGMGSAVVMDYGNGNGVRNKISDTVMAGINMSVTVALVSIVMAAFVP
jgi:hypothetical protein